MVVGKVAKWLNMLDKGKAVILSPDDMADSAKAYLDTGFDHVQQEDIKCVANEVNSEEYPGFSLWERPDGRWTLQRDQVYNVEFCGRALARSKTTTCYGGVSNEHI